VTALETSRGEVCQCLGVLWRGKPYYNWVSFFVLKKTKGKLKERMCNLTAHCSLDLSFQLFLVDFPQLVDHGHITRRRRHQRWHLRRRHRRSGASSRGGDDDDDSSALPITGAARFSINSSFSLPPLRELLLIFSQISPAKHNQISQLKPPFFGNHNLWKGIVKK